MDTKETVLSLAIQVLGTTIYELTIATVNSRFESNVGETIEKGEAVALVSVAIVLTRLKWIAGVKIGSVDRRHGLTISS